MPKNWITLIYNEISIAYVTSTNYLGVARLRDTA